MAILPTDIKLLESERMRDTPDGGGRMTSNIIPSGVLGNVFPKVSRSDSVYGRTNFRKIYLAVKTATTEMYAGAMSVVMKPPGNDLISVTMFSTGSFFDNRTAARDRVESYVVQGPLSRMRVYGDQLIGQKAITVYQRTDEPLPEVGEVIVLSVEKSGFTPAYQYVRIIDFEHEVRKFEDDKGEFTRRIIMLKIGSSLQQTFPGAEVTRYATDPSATKVRVTQVADASKYYGIQPLALEAEAGAFDARLTTVYAPLVPSTQRETPLSLATITESTFDEGCAPGAIRLRLLAPVPAALTRQKLSFRTPTPIQPESLRVIERTHINEVTWRFNAAGEQITRTLPFIQNDWNTWYGLNVNYETGVIEFDYVYTASAPQASQGYVDVEYMPAASVTLPSHTHQIPITLATRGSVYVVTLDPLPKPGSVVMDFRALGRWYRMRDNGAGELVANTPQEGTGTVDYVTGACVATLGALPDVDSAVLFSWGTAIHFEVGQQANVSTTAWQGVATDTPINPGTVQFEWYDGATQRLVTDNGEGRLMGAGEGRINYVSGQYWFRPTVMPAPGATPVLTYDASALEYRDFTPTKDGNGFVTVTVADATLVPKSVLVEWETVRTLTQQEKTRKVVGYQ